MTGETSHFERCIPERERPSIDASFSGKGPAVLRRDQPDFHQLSPGMDWTLSSLCLGVREA